MKTAAAFVTALALFALVAVDGRVLDEQAGETRLAPEFKDAFGADTFAWLLTLPQDQATALAGVVVNNTQTVRVADCCQP